LCLHEGVWGRGEIIHNYVLSLKMDGKAGFVRKHQDHESM
jgi:hypothetical protein